MERDRDWHDMDGPLVRRTWVPETGGWVVTFIQDVMRRDTVTAAVWMPSVAVWGPKAPVPPPPANQAVFLAADLTLVTHQAQPAPT